MAFFTSRRRSLGRQAGFTLVEMLVVTSIILLLVGGGIASFISFNNKQEVLGAAKELQSFLRAAQTFSRVGEKPNGCDRLNGYKVLTQDVGLVKQAQILASCDSGDIVRDSFDFPSNITLNNDIEMVFLGLHGGVEGAGTVQVLNNSGKTYEFVVTVGGEISLGEFL